MPSSLILLIDSTVTSYISESFNESLIVFSLTANTSDSFSKSFSILYAIYFLIAAVLVLTIFKLSLYIFISAAGNKASIAFTVLAVRLSLNLSNLVSESFLKTSTSFNTESLRSAKLFSLITVDTAESGVDVESAIEILTGEAKLPAVMKNNTNRYLYIRTLLKYLLNN